MSMWKDLGHDSPGNLIIPRSFLLHHLFQTMQMPTRLHNSINMIFHLSIIMYLNMWRNFEVSDNRRRGEILRKYGKYVSNNAQKWSRYSHYNIFKSR